MKRMMSLSYRDMTKINGGTSTLPHIQLDYTHTTNSFLENNVQLRQKEYLDLEFKLMNNDSSIGFNSLKGIFEARLKDNNFEEDKIPEDSTLFQGNDKQIYIKDKNNNTIKVFKELNNAKKYIAENMSKGYNNAIEDVKSELGAGFIILEIFGSISTFCGLALGAFISNDTAASKRWRRNQFFDAKFIDTYSMSELNDLGIVFKKQNGNPTSTVKYNGGISDMQVDEEASLKPRISDYFSCNTPMILPAGMILGGLLLIAAGIAEKIQADGGDRII